MGQRRICLSPGATNLNTSSTSLKNSIESFANYDFCELDPNPVRLYLAQLSVNGRDAMERALFRVLQVLNPPHLQKIIRQYKQAGKRKIEIIFDFDWTRLTYSTLLQLRAALLDRYSRKTTDQALNAVRRVLEESFRAGHISRDVFERTTSLPPIRIYPPPIPSGRAVTLDEVEALLKTCLDNQSPNERDGAVFALLGSLGPRSCEIRGLRLADYDIDGQQLLINGKGRKQRRLPLSHEVAGWLERWIQVRGNEPGVLFFSNDKKGILVNRPMSRGLLFKIIQRRCEQAAIRNLSPHDFRRGVITDLLKDEHLFTVTFLAGHSSPNTTRRYDHRPLETVKAAISLLDIDIEI